MPDRPSRDNRQPFEPSLYNVINPNIEQRLDPQTGLADKATFHAIVDTVVQEANRAPAAISPPVSVIFIDLDNFKEVNDKLGHDVGDRFIATMGRVINSSMRSFGHEYDPDSPPTDYASFSEYTPRRLDEIRAAEALEIDAGHIGGDEFALVCRANEHGAFRIIERINDGFEQVLGMPENAGLRRIGTGMSVGVGVHRRGMSASDLLKAADTAMYDNKMNKLPRLSRKQIAALQASQWILKRAKIRQRDVPKYLALVAKNTAEK